MKNKNRLAFKLTLALTIFVTLGCGIASQLFPTPTPVPTSTPTITPSPTTTPTQTPTITPTPLPDISMARIFLKDLPAGFEEIPPDQLGNNQATGDGFKPETTFAFVNTTKFQMIVGMNFLVIDNMDRVGFDLAMNQPEITLKQMVSALGTRNVREEKVLDGVGDLGDVRMGMTMVADMNDVPVRVEIVMFRRGVVAGMVMSMTFPGKPGSVSINELGKLFDQHIQETLGQ